MSDLATLARDIRETLERADVADRRSDDLRITAGQMLLKAREEVQRQGLKWSPWVRENIPDRSARDIRRLLAIVQAPDPAEAAADARKKTREQVMESRLRNQGYRPDVARDIAKEDIRMSAPEGGMPVNQLEALLTAWDAASADIRAQFLSLRAAEIPCMKDHPAPALAAQPTPEPASQPAAVVPPPVADDWNAPEPEPKPVGEKPIIKEPAPVSPIKSREETIGYSSSPGM